MVYKIVFEGVNFERIITPLYLFLEYIGPAHMLLKIKQRSFDAKSTNSSTRKEKGSCVFLFLVFVLQNYSIKIFGQIFSFLFQLPSVFILTSDQTVTRITYHV